MEDSPLTLAHQYALQASNTLSSSSPPYSPRILLDAASSHALAATSFASAAKTTRDHEAHRTLELLVREHTRWADRLRRQAEQPAPLETVAEGGSESEGEGGGGGASTRRETATHPATPPPPPFAGAGAAHYPARLQKSTSSLATNLASARGIPQTRTTAITPTPSRRNSRRTGMGESAKPTTSPLTLLPPDAPPTAAIQDASFSKFYNSLNSLITKIGSPFTASLAFTGLPVGTGPNDNEVTAEILPKAWAQGRGRGRNLGLNDTAGGESFYVVPYSGGTMSYAGVVRRSDSSNSSSTSTADDGRSRRTNSNNNTTTTARSPTTTTTATPKDEELARFAGHDKTLEELQLENATLRRTLEQLSRNMSKWQKQTRESENQLKSSIMALGGGVGILSQAQRRSWLHVPDEGEDGDDEVEGVGSEGRRVGEMELIREEAQERAMELDERVATLERELKEREAEMERMGRENEKLRRTVTKFKERWDALREGAKKRERNAGGLQKLGAVGEGGGE